MYQRADAGRTAASTGYQTAVMAATDLTLALVLVIALAGPAAASEVGILVLMVSRWALGAYQWRMAATALDGAPRAVLAACLGAGAAAAVTGPPGIAAGESAGLAVGVAGLALIPARAVQCAVLKAGRRREWCVRRALIVGDGDCADLIHREVLQSPEHGLVVDTQRPTPSGEMWTQVRTSQPEIVILASDDPTPTTDVRRVMSAGVTVYVVPAHGELFGEPSADDHIWRVPLIRLCGPRSRWEMRGKRVIDFMVAFIAMLLTAPVLILCAILVGRETGSSFIFRQQRVGRGGESFNLLKLQTLKPVTEAEGDTLWNISQDDRLGPVGRFLRKTSLDELPQLWNVLRGDMSIVGPRPERPHFVERFSRDYPHYADRHRVHVGLTGLAQIHGLRGDTCIRERALFDNRYADTWSLWGDIKIMVRTVPSLIRGTGG